MIHKTDQIMLQAAKFKTCKTFFFIFLKYFLNGLCESE